MPICDIFNQFISQGTFPDDWKYARVTSLYKQGDCGDVNNYRPISVIPIVEKVFERIVYEQLYAYLEEHDILCQKSISGVSCLSFNCNSFVCRKRQILGHIILITEKSMELLTLLTLLIMRSFYRN